MNDQAGALCSVEPIALATAVKGSDPNCREQYLKSIFEAVDALVVLDDDARFIDVNAAASDLIGRTREELIGRSVSETLENPADFAPIWKTFRAEGKHHDQRWLVRPDGTRRRIEVLATANIVTGRHLAVWRDSTDRFLLESELVQAEKYEALARLAGGIAHNLANLLNVICGHTELMVREVGITPGAQRHSDSILAATKHAADLVTQLSLFGQQQVLTPTVLDLAAFVAKLRTPIRSLVPENVELAFAYLQKPAYVRADKNQMAQILFTIASYAGDQLSGGGCITVEVDASRLDRSREGFCCRIPAGDYIIVKAQVKSTNNTAHQTRTPANLPCTPRPIPRNAPAVYSTVKQNHGFLSLDLNSEDGVGFTVFFPKVSSKPAAWDSLPSNGERLGGNETILLVEDDTALREATVEYLKSFGYCVAKARDGQEAMLVAKSMQHIDALITDLRMPNMGGRELAEKLGNGNPGFKVMFMSGRVDGELIQHQSSSPAPLVLKPFEMRELVRTLRQLLDNTGH